MPPTLPDPSLFKVSVDIEVRWADMDSLGHVNNSCYLTYFETARIAYFERLGPEQRVGAGHIGPVLAHATCDFIKPVAYPATLTSLLRAVRVGNTSYEFEHLLRDKKTGVAVAFGLARLVSYDFVARAKAPIPAAMRERIRAVDGI
jgi:acyl-CoA thioester hydrolase